MIHVQDLGKSFLDFQRGWVPAIREISFDCHPGEIFGLLGPNGAGKTTTLRILSTVLKPTSGRAVVAGHDVVAEPQAVRSNIGYMSASTGIYDRMTAWELVEYFGRLYGMSRDSSRQRMEVIFDPLQMNDFRDVLGSKMYRHEAESFLCADDRARSARPDLRRADLRARCPGARAVFRRSRAPRPRARRSSFPRIRCMRSRSFVRGWRSSTGGRYRPRAARKGCWNSSISPVLKSCSSPWLRKRRLRAACPRPGIASHTGAGCLYPFAPAFPRTGLIHALVDLVCDFSPRGPRSAS